MVSIWVAYGEWMLSFDEPVEEAPVVEEAAVVEEAEPAAKTGKSRKE